MKVKYSKKRRGVLLLIILGLLAMFALVAIAFVTVTNHAEEGAKAMQRMGEYPEDPQADLHQAIMVVLRGSGNPGSPLYFHSLLEDMYGYNPAGVNVFNPGTMGSPTLHTSRQLFTFDCPGAAISNKYHCVGCVLTMMNGTHSGQSTLIVGADKGSNRLLAVSFPGDRFFNGTNNVPAAGDMYIINGAPFSGQGFGYNPASGDLDRMSGAAQVALLPNLDAATRLGFGQPSANEPYDAPDYQNLHMGVPGGLKPSYHSPALVNYWMTRLGIADWRTLPDGIMLRPSPNQHPDFSGSNPYFHPVNGPWDVDTDGDGIADSIWVDPGLPVRQGADGRPYKVLVAVQCLDLDGRLNVNAHGLWSQCWGDTDTNGRIDYYDAAKTSEIFIPGSDYKFADGSTQAPFWLPRGLGYGPPEINLAPLFATLADPFSVNFAGLTMYQGILGGGSGWDGRYGVVGGAQPGNGGADDYLSWNRNFACRGNYWATVGGSGQLSDSQGSPLAPFGYGAIGLDPGGRPMYTGMGYNPANRSLPSSFDDPYEINLSQNTTRGVIGSTPVDNPFSVTELERVLRPFDRDSSNLPSRLYDLTYDGGLGRSVFIDRRHCVTTESWDVPSPGVSMPKVLRGALGRSTRHATDLLAAWGVSVDQYHLLFPPELLANLRMDVNRPFGNGIDNNGNFIVDEPGEQSADQITMYTRPGSTASAPLDHDNDGSPGVAKPYGARQLYARHLYVLMTALIDPGFQHSSWDPASLAEERARWIAQWAINAVDFRDRDSSMTPFEYDVNPLNGWDVDNDYTTNDHAERRLVWGCERPELLLTETLAFHDRRTLDLASPSKEADPNKDPSLQPEDDGTNDFDQKWKPQGTLIFELYCPWTNMEPRPPELCSATNGGVDLTKMSPAVGGAGPSPVWRVVTVDKADAGKDPDTENPAIERAVYFVSSAAALPGGAALEFRPHDTVVASISPVFPGRYVVIGPGDPCNPGQTTSTTYIGLKNGETMASPDPGDRRRIVLNMGAGNQVQVYSGGSTDDMSGKSVQNATAVIIDTVAGKAAGHDVPRLSISEPDGGYPAADAGGMAYDPATNGYTQPYDKPLDVGKPLETEIATSGRHDEVKVVHLQRLANPLLPYDATANPYLTIDSMPVDLTTFNGISPDTDPNDATQMPQLPGSLDSIDFYARERGENNGTTGGSPLLWRREPLGVGSQPKANVNNPPPPAGLHRFNRPLHHTLGFLNDDFGSPISASGYVGDPPTPFPWLTWNNRPYISPLELMLVPALSSSQLLTSFSVAPSTVNPYDTDIHPFAHLPNFFMSDSPGSVGTTSELHRILEYLRVPSPFVGTSLQVSPTRCIAGTDHWFHPPFNFISKYREPGRVNLNTIFRPEAYVGLMNYYPGGMSTSSGWQRFVKHRRGYGAVDGDVMKIDATGQYPTPFAGVFRASADCDLVPLDGLKPAREVNATVMREGSTADEPLFNYASTSVVNNTDRNPFFRYHGIQRLGNLTTTRSNVYAVWITTGYFYVNQSGELQQEVGSDAGTVKRHRGFFIVDRSIPVGFERGKDINSENTILLERVLE